MKKLILILLGIVFCNSALAADWSTVDPNKVVIGVNMSVITPEIAKILKSGSLVIPNKGLIVLDILDNKNSEYYAGPAYEAGLRKLDLIIKADKKVVKTVPEFWDIINKSDKSKSLEIEYLRPVEVKKKLRWKRFKAKVAAKKLKFLEKPDWEEIKRALRKEYVESHPKVPLEIRSAILGEKILKGMTIGQAQLAWNSFLWSRNYKDSEGLSSWDCKKSKARYTINFKNDIVTGWTEW